MSPFLDPNDDDGLHAVIVALILIILTLAIVFAGVSHHVGKAAAKAALGKLKQAPIKQQLYRHRKRGPPTLGGRLTKTRAHDTGS